ncbi:MAG TPA: NifB/NifX family molybdenum-iron cluster-binding protein [Prolixibacteraceae bacterium]|mgnify:CR=1 FL=1|nr:NifB/NifX family molybdenum-iron cluster-binding protein [Prolixibacteraceae bacterium]HPR84643.1 NifB/NifX family molybdenum-iron cluster-binding protein [Prolixibacteraceae bacterium]
MTIKMKIAVPAKADGQIDNHFGHCESYKVFAISNESTISEVDEIKSSQGCGCKSNIAGVLAANGVSVLLAGGIGNGAINVLNKAGINVIRGCEGNITEIVKQYAAGRIIDSGEVCHHHDDGHVCSH